MEDVAKTKSSLILVHAKFVFGLCHKSSLLCLGVQIEPSLLCG